MLESLGVPRYRVIRRVGSGGMGELFEVWDERLDRRVAVKRLHPHVIARPDGEALVLHEARSAAKIEHPNVVRVYGVERSGNELLIEMQFIEGRPLCELLNGTPLPKELAADLLRQILGGLAACHAHGVIHRDLKPANVLVDAAGNVYLSDFGIAQVLRPDGCDTEHVSAWGTPRYSPPEAWEGGNPTPRWDLYAAGVIMREVLTGKTIFDGDTVADVRFQVSAGVEGSILADCPGLSREFAALIDSLTEKSPSARPESAQAALRLLRNTAEYSAAIDSTRPSSRLLVKRKGRTGRSLETEPVSPPAVRGGWWPRGAALLLVFLVVAVIGVGIVVLRPKPVTLPGEEPAVVPAAEKALEVHEPKFLTLMRGGTLYFAYDDGIHGEEIWGCIRGGEPVLIRDIVRGPGSSYPKYFHAMERGDYYFTAETPKTGREIWRGIQTASLVFDRPQLVKDIVPGAMGSMPNFLMGKGNILLFLASTPNAGTELWATMGAEGQTSMLADLRTGGDDSATNSLRTGSGVDSYYWVANNDKDAATSGGTEMGIFRYDFTEHVLEYIMPAHFETYGVVELNGKAYFLNSDATHGVEPWVYDLKTKQAQVFLDLWPGGESSTPHAFCIAGERIFFRATTDGLGQEPWISDGTPGGTRRIMDVNPGEGGSNAYNFYDLGGGEFAFRAQTDAHGLELWVTDGTPEGTYMPLDIFAGPKSGAPYNEERGGGMFFFSATSDVYGEELFVLKKSSGRWQVSLVADLMPGLESSYPHDLSFADETTGYFIANVTETEGWIYQLSITGDTIDVKSIPRPEPASYPVEP